VPEHNEKLFCNGEAKLADITDRLESVSSETLLSFSIANQSLGFRVLGRGVSLGL